MPESPASAFRAFLDYRNVGRLCLTLLLTLSIVLSHFLLSGHNHQRVLQLAVLASASAIMVARGSISLPQGLLRLLLLLFFMLGALSAALSFSPRHAVAEVSLLLLLLLLALAAAREMAADFPAALAQVLTLLALGGALYLAQVIVPWAGAIVEHAQLDPTSLAPSFSNFRLFNHAQTVGLPLFVLLCCRQGPAYKKSRFVLTACWWALLISLGGRGSLVGLLAGSVGALILRGRHAIPFCKMMLATAFGGLLVYAVFFVCIPLAAGLEPFGLLTHMAGRTAHDPASSRVELWLPALHMMEAAPWLGIGPAHFAHLMVASIAAHPHNWMLQFGAEWGVPALLCLCAMVALGMRSLAGSAARLAAADTVNQTLLAAWIATGIAIVVDGLVSGNIVMPVSQLMIALYLACARGWLLSLAPAASATPGPRLAVRAVVLVAAIGLLWYVATDVRQTTRPYGELAHPRFWLDGHF